MNRRAFLQGIAGVAGALILPPSLAENAETARRYWSLGAMPGKVMGPDDLFPGWRKLEEAHAVYWARNTQRLGLPRDYRPPMMPGPFLSKEEELRLARMGLRMWL